MLSLVLILVLAALGLLVTALITASSLWAWLSIGASALAAVVLFVDWLRRRARQRKAVARASGEPDEETSAGADEAASAGDEMAAADIATDATDATDTTGTADVDTAEPSPTGADMPTAEDTASAPPALATPERSAIGAYDTHTPPGEEETDAADLLMVSELDDQVLVIDEQPRYHLPECGWLVDKDTIPIAVSEARELGFTPCARCGPDTSLVTRARKKRKRSLGKFGRE